MKKLFVLMTLASISFLAYSQDVKVNINNQDGTAIDDCPYRINGICASEDIGGVDAEFIRDDENQGDASLIITNYNSCAVSIIWKIRYRYNDYIDYKSGSTVLGVDGQKKIKLYSGTNNWSLEGLIVRKLAQ